MDQIALASLPMPRIGHNQPRERINPIEGFNAQLAERHADLIARFRDLELACARVADPIQSDEARTMTQRGARPNFSTALECPCLLRTPVAPDRAAASGRLGDAVPALADPT